jgi:hypothetical protein
MLYLRGYGSQTVENCLIRGRGTDGSARTTALYGSAGTTITFTGCTFEADTFGIFPYDGQSNVVIEHNTFKGDTGVNWARTNIGSVTIRWNLFNGCRVGVYRVASASATNVTIQNNTFYRCGGPTVYYDGAILFRDFTGGNFGPAVRDNLIVGKGAASAEYNGLGSYTTAVSTIDADNNGFWNMKVSGGSAQVAYFAAWKTVAQLNGISGASGNLVGATDPFVNAAGGDFRLVRLCWAATAAGDGGYIGAFAPNHLAGDANDDGMVDMTDYITWFAHYAAAGANWAQGDFNDDHLVDMDDYTIWYANYARVDKASSQALPAAGPSGAAIEGSPVGGNQAAGGAWPAGLLYAAIEGVQATPLRSLVLAGAAGGDNEARMDHLRACMKNAVRCGEGVSPARPEGVSPARPAGVSPAEAGRLCEGKIPSPRAWHVRGRPPLLEIGNTGVLDVLGMPDLQPSLKK